MKVITNWFSVRLPVTNAWNCHSLYTAFSSNVGAWGMWACSLFLSFPQCRSSEFPCHFQCRKQSLHWLCWKSLCNRSPLESSMFSNLCLYTLPWHHHISLFSFIGLPASFFPSWTVNSMTMTFLIRVDQTIISSLRLVRTLSGSGEFLLLLQIYSQRPVLALV